MSEEQELAQQINALTLKIEERYPELYRYLEESPQTIPNSAHPDLGAQALGEHLAFLQQMLKHHLDTH